MLSLAVWFAVSCYFTWHLSKKQGISVELMTLVLGFVSATLGLALVLAWFV